MVLRLSLAIHFFPYPARQFRTSLFTTGATPFGVPRRGSIFKGCQPVFRNQIILRTSWVCLDAIVDFNLLFLFFVFVKLRLVVET